MLQYWPQIVYLGLIVAGLLMAGAKHGEPNTSKHNFWASLIGAAVSVGLLYAGGFFR